MSWGQMSSSAPSQHLLGTIDRQQTANNKDREETSHVAMDRGHDQRAAQFSDRRHGPLHGPAWSLWGDGYIKRLAAAEKPASRPGLL